ncbi:NIPSNAP family protein [Streptomyces subrutilus]|uniref:Nipsnap superfamily protein n=1 Tax=Streptomyces subrutilus TaxID=36818 RepID=A0A1E5PU60_9ACTN|nr:NIPSNAP family protein [Streptomyces subrutilus]OEJ33126.1 nipsnap superfamily protein [Streptomyces subrutilus]
MDLIVELRQYTLRPGARDTLVELFEREFVSGQEAAGITLGGRFRDLDDPDRFVWLRSFPDMAARERALRAFYDGPVWRAHRQAANATMLDSDDVLLLRGPGFAAPDTGGPVVATVCHPLDAEAFAGHFERRLRPALTAAGSAPRAVHRTEHAENTFPALPVRKGEEVLVWFTAGAAGTPPDLPDLPDLSGHLRAAPQRLRLEPVSRVPGRREGSGGGVRPARPADPVRPARPGR